MVFVPMMHQQESVRETRHSRELGQRVDDAVREYKRLHPELSDADVRAALLTSLRRSGAQDDTRQRRMVIVLLAALVAAFTGVALNGGFAGPGDTQIFRYLGLVAAIAAIAIAIIRSVRRNSDG